jgi:chalcone/stilbene synthase family protein
MATRLSIGIVSAGRVGSALGSALRAAGHTIVGAHAPSEASLDRLGAMLPGVPALSVEEVARRAEVLLFAVPDDELGPLVEGLAKLGCFTAGQLAIHVAGRYGVSVLEPAARAGALALAVHPAMTFTGTSLDVARLVGCPFAVTAPATLLPIGQALVTETGGTPVVVAEEDRGLYHAALAHGANHLVTLVAQSMRVLEALGVEAPGAYLAPLLQAALDGTLSSGESALTGPVARGDVGTVREHLASLDVLAATGDYADIPPAYRALARATAARVAARSLREPPAIDRLLAELDGGASGLATPGSAEPDGSVDSRLRASDGGDSSYSAEPD